MFTSPVEARRHRRCRTGSTALRRG
jgi:hypothetical protein